MSNNKQEREDLLKALEDRVLDFQALKDFRATLAKEKEDSHLETYLNSLSHSLEEVEWEEEQGEVQGSNSKLKVMMFL